MHDTHALAPVTLPYVLAGQEVQFALDAPATGLKVAIGHCVQTEEAAAEYAPGPHDMHALVPGTLPYVLAGHAAQLARDVPAAALNVVTGHREHCDEPASEYEPAAHERHALAPRMLPYVLAGQNVQLELEVPGTLLKFPMAQSVQTVELA